MNSKFALRVLGASLAVVATGSFVGALAGTVAWYAYSTRVSISYEGTSVANTEMLQIGLDVTGLNTTNPTAPKYYILPEHELTETVEAKIRIYAFADEGAGMSATTIRDYLVAKGYASNELRPVTSREYSNDSLDAGDNSAFNLYKSPVSGYTTFYNADNEAYAYLQLAFRIKLSDGSYSVGDSVWLNNAQVDPAQNDHLVYRALRIAVDGTNQFIVNPSAQHGGTTKVGGVLCLRRDSEYYDTNQSHEEILYGDFTSIGNPTSFVNDTFEDVNDSGYTVDDLPNTFAGKHAAGTTGYVANSFVPKVAKYRAIEDVQAADDGSGGLTGGYPIATITQYDANTTTKNIGVVDMKIYLEGWDYSVIDNEISHGFTLGLQFQVDTIH